MWVDTSVGNTDFRTPYDPQAAVRWDFWDDYNGAWGRLASWTSLYRRLDPDIWMAYEHDADGDEGLATSWIGYRLLGTNREPTPEAGVRPVSFNMWRFRGVPERDDEYETPDAPGTLQPGKYQVMANGHFDVGETQENNFAAQSNWVSMMSIGPFRSWAPGDTLSITFAIVAAPDSLGLLSNSKVAQVAYNAGFSIPGGPPSPRLEVATDNNSLILRWAPGDSLGNDGQSLPLDAAERSPNITSARSRDAGISRAIASTASRVRTSPPIRSALRRWSRNSIASTASASIPGCRRWTSTVCGASSTPDCWTASRTGTRSRASARPTWRTACPSSRADSTRIRPSCIRGRLRPPAAARWECIPIRTGPPRCSSPGQFLA